MFKDKPSFIKKYNKYICQGCINLTQNNLNTQNQNQKENYLNINFNDKIKSKSLLSEIQKSNIPQFLLNKRTSNNSNNDNKYNFNHEKKQINSSKNRSSQFNGTYALKQHFSFYKQRKKQKPMFFYDKNYRQNDSFNTLTIEQEKNKVSSNKEVTIFSNKNLSLNKCNYLQKEEKKLLRNSLYKKSKQYTEGEKDNYFSSKAKHTRHVSEYPNLHQELHNRHTQTFSVVTNSLYLSNLYENSEKTDNYRQENQNTARFNYEFHNNKHQYPKQLSLNQFFIGPCKGKGRFGKVHMVIHKQTGFIMAMKMVSLSSIQGMTKYFINQIKLQLYIRHPFIVQMYGYFIEGQYCYLLMQYMQQGNLYEYLKRKKKLEEEETVDKMGNICMAIDYLHNNSIIHRDLKPENIVMTFDSCKLCDFSWAVYSVNDRRNTNCGTLDYVSPEIIEGEDYNKSIDSWSLGVLLYEILMGRPAFYNVNMRQTIKLIRECNFQLNSSVSEEAKDLIISLLRKNPEQRRKIGQILQHPFFKKKF